MLIGIVVRLRSRFWSNDLAITRLLWNVRELIVAIWRIAFRPGKFRVRLWLAAGRDERVVVVLIFFLLWKTRWYGNWVVEGLECFEPLVLVHCIAGDEVREHFLHAGIVGEFVQPCREQSASRFSQNDYWRSRVAPRSLEGGYRTYVLSYQSIPSYQVYLFVDTTDGVAKINRGDGNDNGPFEVGTDVSVGRIHGSPSGTKRSFVTVDLEGVTDHSVDSSM